MSIAHDFRGWPLPAHECATLRFGLVRQELVVEVDAPYFADVAPATPVGATDRLWEYEVCELFIADAGERYLEVELSPHGHHLVLQLDGVRNVIQSGLPIAYSATIMATADAHSAVADAAHQPRYRGRARMPAAYLPARPSRVNAYLIHGAGAGRAYHAHSPPLGETPDFHRLGCFVPVRWA